MGSKATFVIGAAILLLAVMPLSAHHALAAQYNLNESVTLKGTVIKVQWMNPHVRLYMERMVDGSADMPWQLELASPNLLVLGGLKIDSLRQGDHVTVSIYPARDGSNLGYAKKITRDTR